MTTALNYQNEWTSEEEPPPERSELEKVVNQPVKVSRAKSKPNKEPRFVERLLTSYPVSLPSKITGNWDYPHEITSEELAILNERLGKGLGFVSPKLPERYISKKEPRIPVILNERAGLIAGGIAAFSFISFLIIGFVASLIMAPESRVEDSPWFTTYAYISVSITMLGMAYVGLCSLIWGHKERYEVRFTKKFSTRNIQPKTIDPTETKKYEFLPNGFLSINQESWGEITRIDKMLKSLAEYPVVVKKRFYTEAALIFSDIEKLTDLIVLAKEAGVTKAYANVLKEITTSTTLIIYRLRKVQEMTKEFEHLIAEKVDKDSSEKINKKLLNITQKAEYKPYK